MSDLKVVCNELKEGRNLANIRGIKRNEQYENWFELDIKASSGVEENLRIFNDSNRSSGLIRQLINATIFQEGKKSYNLNEIIGKEVIIHLESAKSKNGNDFWKIKKLEKVTDDTDLTEFELEEKDLSDEITEEYIDDVFELENDLNDSLK